jgi:hypothetical protein
MKKTSVILVAFSPNKYLEQQNPLQQIFGEAHISNNVSTDEKKRKEIMLIIISPCFFLIIG